MSPVHYLEAYFLQDVFHNTRIATHISLCALFTLHDYVILGLYIKTHCAYPYELLKLVHATSR